jgi:hypothetical protein
MAIHRLHMPMMPSGKKTGSVVRLPVTQPGKRAGSMRMTLLENGEDNLEGYQGGPEREVAEPPAPFVARRKIDERRRMFMDAAPRMIGPEEGTEIRGITLKTLIASVGIATLILLVLIFALGRG